ncbi:hypothetical protein [Rhodococcus jostii]|uniref:hypothetical protein n=1 Tax=Rhodococcus jostii TaxID=132919 RepID=UPI00362C469A
MNQQQSHLHRKAADRIAPSRLRRPAEHLVQGWISEAAQRLTPGLTVRYDAPSAGRMWAEGAMIEE